MSWKNGFICLIDSLGTKNITGIDKTKQYLKHMDIIENALKKKSIDYEKELIEFGFPLIEIISFSDNFYIIQNCDTANELDLVPLLLRMVELIARLTSSALLLNLPFRGAISFGEYMLSKPRIAGSAVTDVADIYDKPQIIGTVIHSNVNSIIKNNINIINSNIVPNFISSYQTPIVCDGQIIKKITYVVNWPYYFNLCCIGDNNDTLITINTMFDKLRTNDPKVNAKIENTGKMFLNLFQSNKTILNE